MNGASAVSPALSAVGAGFGAAAGGPRPRRGSTKSGRKQVGRRRVSQPVVGPRHTVIRSSLTLLELKLCRLWLAHSALRSGRFSPRIGRPTRVTSSATEYRFLLL